MELQIDTVVGRPRAATELDRLSGRLHRPHQARLPRPNVCVSLTRISVVFGLRFGNDRSRSTRHACEVRSSSRDRPSSRDSSNDHSLSLSQSSTRDYSTRSLAQVRPGRDLRPEPGESRRFIIPLVFVSGCRLVSGLWTIFECSIMPRTVLHRWNSSQSPLSFLETLPRYRERNARSIPVSWGRRRVAAESARPGPSSTPRRPAARARVPSACATPTASGATPPEAPERPASSLPVRVSGGVFHTLRSKRERYLASPSFRIPRASSPFPRFRERNLFGQIDRERE